MIKQHLTLIEHIRKRPGMFIGELSIRGLKSILGCFFEDILLNNSKKTEIIVELKSNNLISLKIENINTTLFAETINNLDSENEFVSVGLPLIIALSEKTRVKISSKLSLFTLDSTNGLYNCNTQKISEINDYVEVEFQIDKSLFKEIKINYEVLNQFIRKYAFINTNYRFISNDSTKQTKQINIYDYPNGLSDQLDYKIGEQLYGQSFFRLDLKTRIGEYDYQICISYQDIWLGQTYINTYANYDELIFGGSLENGIIDGLNLAFKQVLEKKKIEIDKRKIREQLILIAVIKGDNFDFYGSTKTKLNMPKVRKVIKEFISEKTLSYLSENKNIEDKLINKLERE